jgi:hypothetical protein
MQRPFASIRAVGLSEDCHDADDTPARSPQTKGAPCIDCVSAVGLANARTGQQLKLIAARMAHPSYNASGRNDQTAWEGRSC